jgi:hypothetical protein
LRELLLFGELDFLRVFLALRVETEQTAHFEDDVLDDVLGVGLAFEEEVEDLLARAEPLGVLGPELLDQQEDEELDFL